MPLEKLANVTWSKSLTLLGAWAAIAIVALKEFGIVVLKLKSLTIDLLLWIWNSNKSVGLMVSFVVSIEKSITLTWLVLSMSVWSIKLWCPAHAWLTSDHMLLKKSNKLKSSTGMLSPL